MTDMADPTFTLGIEEEFQVVDPQTRELKSHIQEMFAEGEKRLKDEIKREMHDPVIEVGTPICRDIAHARREVTRLRGEIIRLARENGLRIAAAGTHPISHWKEVSITDAPRYDQIVYDLQMVARANLIFGLHVHVAIEDLETRVQIMNAARYFLPHIFALSVNSPFWCGSNTGWKSYRAKVFERFPRTGLPDYFRTKSEFEQYVNTLIATNSIDNAKKIWWDVRPHPFFPTLEYRICDVPLRVDETVCFAALFQAITVKLYKLYKQNLSWRLYRRSLLHENKARAARFGTEGKLIDFGKSEEVPFAVLLEELLEFIDDVVDDLGSRKEVEYARQLVPKNTGADRQLRVFEETKDLRAVVDYIINETEHGIPLA
ncbi:MAG: glutamate---cysteine ligase / carboxylate-amine ligase [Acidobacteriota bacterium]|jgi:carboxylate-amine ligase|nr:glutamate---cysteine ligase / carboxylate-amine ligase [Acidobacteriota bacterium]